MAAEAIRNGSADLKESSVEAATAIGDKNKR